MESVGSFFRTLSHEIRNDLNAIELLSAYVQEIAGPGAVRDELRQVRASAQYAARRLVSVLRSFQTPEPEWIEYSFAGVAEDWRRVLQKEKPEAAARVDWEIAEGHLAWKVDVSLVLELLDELLENAVGFSPRESRVGVSLRMDGATGYWEIRQQASPPESDPAQWGKVPLASTRSRHYGLGLFRSRRIVEALCGELGYLYDESRREIVTWVRFPGGSGA